jgi:hypothetical protein
MIFLSLRKILTFFSILEVNIDIINNLRGDINNDIVI